MNSLQRYTCKATLIGFCLAAASGAYANVGSINSAFIDPRVFNDDPTAGFSVNNSYPGLIQFNESSVNTGTGFANRDVWYFSNNGGASAYQFQPGDYFNASMSINLTGNDPNLKDLEAGWLFSDPSGTFGGDLQSIVIGNNGAVVQFGGPSYYPFSPAAGGYPPAAGSLPPGGVPNYALGQTYILGLNYVLDPNTGHNAFQYWVNGGSGAVWALSAPGNTYFDLGAGVSIGAPGDFLGGYLQVGIDTTNPNQSGQAIFDDITITSVPEPATLALLGLGIVPLLLRRRRS